MPIGTKSDFRIYHDQFFSGLVETAVQETAALNSRGIVVTSRRMRGDYEYQAFIKRISSLVVRRDVTSVASANDLAVTMDESISVKLNRRIGPVAQTLDAWRKQALPFARAEEGDEGGRAFSRYLGAMVGKEVAIEMLDTGLVALRQAIANVSAMTHTIASNGTMTTNALIDALALMGDSSNRVIAWVMHSKPFFDLMKYQVNPANNGDVVANGTLVAGTPLTVNRPVFVTDSSSLVVTGTPNLYHTFGLTEGAIQIVESEDQELAFTLVTGLENLVYRMQGEFAYNLAIKGFKWNVASGGANPTNTAVATSTNWTRVATSDKDLAAVRIISG